MKAAEAVGLVDGTNQEVGHVGGRVGVADRGQAPVANGVGRDIREGANGGRTIVGTLELASVVPRNVVVAFLQRERVGAITRGCTGPLGFNGEVAIFPGADGQVVGVGCRASDVVGSAIQGRGCLIAHRIEMVDGGGVAGGAEDGGAGVGRAMSKEAEGEDGGTGDGGKGDGEAVGHNCGLG